MIRNYASNFENILMMPTYSNEVSYEEEKNLVSS